jgi:hypothetical protein
MKLQVAQTRINQLNLLVAMVDLDYIGPAGDEVIRKLMAFYPHLPAMLVWVGEKGFLAHAQFQTHRVLALLQLEELELYTIDLDNPPEEELPF